MAEIVENDFDAYLKNRLVEFKDRSDFTMKKIAELAGINYKTLNLFATREGAGMNGENTWKLMKFLEIGVNDIPEWMKCQTKYCRNDAYKNPNTGYQRTHCSKCRKRQYRKSHPYKYFYQKLRDSARERDIPFNLRFREFKNLWLKHQEKWEEKLSGVHGMSGKTWTVDRKDPDGAYQKDNVQILSLRRNVVKYMRNDVFHLEIDWRNIKEVELQPKAPF